MPAPRAIVSTTADRLAAARSEVADARQALENALERRDQLVVQARSERMSQRAIAQAAGISQPHVIRILAGAEPGMVLPT